MFGKLKAGWMGWRGSRAIRKEIKKMEGKPWWKSTQVWGAIIKTGCGILTALNIVEINADQAAELADKVGVAVTTVGTIFGQVLEIWGKRKHAERVSTGGV